MLSYKIVFKTIVSMLMLLSFYSHSQDKIPFANEVQAFQHRDRVSFPPQNGILFIGSSSIRQWRDLEQRFAGYPVIKRGVGGSELWQWVKYYTPTLIYPYHPAKIFIYIGENDIASKRSAETVAQDFKTLWDMVHQKLPQAKIYFLSIKQSPSRATTYATVVKTNKLISTFMKNRKNSLFIDINTTLLNPKTNQPDSVLFESDLLHLKATGYDRWEQIIRPYLD